jgi:hypothetical protein
VASEDGTKLFVPESDALTELQQGSRYGIVTRRWLMLFREISRLLARFSATGEQNGVVITDDTGTAVASRNTMENVPYLAGNFTASAGAWTVAEADIITYASNRLGRMMVVAFELTATTVTATPGELRIDLPGDAIAQRQISTLCYLSDNGTPAVGRATVTDGGTYIVISRLDAANFAAAADTTDVRGEILLEVE